MMTVLDRWYNFTSVEDINESLHAAVADWHTLDHDVSRIPLHEYLGFTQEEYAIWVRNPAKIADIISLRILDEAVSRVNLLKSEEP